MHVAGIGRVLFWEGGSLWIALIVGVSEFHSHHAVQLCLPLEGSAQFKTGSEADWVSYAGAIISPDTVHTFRAPGKVVANIFFEPESTFGRNVLARFGASGIAALSTDTVRSAARPLAEAYFAQADDDTLVALARHAIAAVSGSDLRPDPTDPRVVRAIDAIHRRLDQPVSLAEVAREVALSRSRFRHLFVSETGISFRAFVLWARLNKALAIGFGGASWTEAAHAATFADSAHLSRTCRRMFGFAPTAARSRRRNGPAA